MLKRVLLIVLSSVFTFFLHAQKMKMQIIGHDTIYVMEPTDADKLYDKGDIEGAIAAYRKQMRKEPGSDNFHNLACCFVKNGQNDSAFKYLYMDAGSDTSPFVLTDPDLWPLRVDSNWAAFQKKIMAGIRIKYSARLKDFDLAEKLWDMQAKDQAYYYEIGIADKKMGMNSPVSLALWNAKEILNQENVAELDSIINAKGWPMISDVGHLASGTAFLIVQHSTLQLQEKYLPLIKSLCEKGEADWQSYALMYDRVQISQGKPQLYGSQLTYDPKTKQNKFFPIDDEKNVDKRRSDMGMEPLEDYAAQFGIKYHLPQ